jgi:hypothetical protein
MKITSHSGLSDVTSLTVSEKLAEWLRALLIACRSLGSVLGDSHLNHELLRLHAPELWTVAISPLAAALIDRCF